MFGQGNETLFDPSVMSALIFETANSSATFEFLQDPYQILTVFLRFAEKKLTANQKKILIFIREHENKLMTFNSLAESAYNEIKIPFSTAKYTIKSLRDLLLITTGTKDNPKKPVSLTQVGKIVADFLIKKEKER